jgi:LmbE family N-acetylglucosaminyl deacetylase
MNVACVFAHQDDEMACLATLLRLRRERGATISLIAMTNGDKGAAWDPDRPLAEVAALRDREMRAVAAGLDASYVCLGRQDGFFFDDESVRMDLIEALRAARAELVFTHFGSDYNADHVATAAIACQAALFTEIASTRTEHPALPAAPAIFHVDPGAGYGFEATHFVAFEEEIAAEKARLIRLHASQMDVMRVRRGSDYADITLEANRVTGARLALPYAEAFRPCLMDRRIPLGSVLP